MHILALPLLEPCCGVSVPCRGHIGIKSQPILLVLPAPHRDADPVIIQGTRVPSHRPQAVVSKPWQRGSSPGPPARAAS
eukprot:2912585-Rhodomonas_salina.2